MLLENALQTATVRKQLLENALQTATVRKQLLERNEYEYSVQEVLTLPRE